MKYLHFDLLDKELPHAVVSSDMVYLLKDTAYKNFADSRSTVILQSARQFRKVEVSKLLASPKTKQLVIYNPSGEVECKLQFPMRSQLQQFIDGFPEFEKQLSKRKARINPSAALLLMLLAYAFLWAGTRPSAAEINADGFRVRIVAMVVNLLHGLESVVGQQGLLLLGVMLSLLLLYLIFRPELHSLRDDELIYLNPRHTTKP